MDNTQKALYSIGGALVILIMTVSLSFLNTEKKVPSTPLTAGRAQTAASRDPFEGLVLAARAAYVWDVRDRKPLFSMNGEAQLPLASLTKVMTAVVAVESGSADSVVTITRDAVALEGDQGLRPGERWSLSDLLDVTLLSSSNDGARAIASAVGAGASSMSEDGDPFVRAMNQKARALGLTQTYFLNESGLDVNQGVSGAYGSARDTARLFEYVITRHPSLVEATTRTALEAMSLSGTSQTVKNTNKFVEEIPGLMASKTGFTDLAGGNLAVAFDAGIAHPVIIVVMGSTEDGRFTDVEKLVFASLKHLKNGQYDGE